LKANASNLPGMTRRTGLGALLLMLLSLFLTPAARSQEVPAEQLKAAFLYNFVRFVEWPTNALGAESNPLIIGVIGKGGDQFADSLATLLKEKKAHNHPLVVKKLTSPADAATCHVVFISDGEPRRAQIADAIRKKPILLVGEADDLFDIGGMINIVQEGKQLRFDVNLQAAEQSNLTMSSHLLKLARKTKKAGGVQ
jgi:hypothetical protein